MKFKAEIIPNYRIAYIRRVGPYGPANKEVMEKLKGWAREKNLLQTSILLAIPQDNPEDTPPEECRFDACIILSKDNTIDDTVCEGELYGGKHLIIQVKHTEEDMQKAYADIFPLLRNNGYQIDNRPIMERYTVDMVNNHYCEICVPVR
ncbi:DNA gyrase inhibitor [Oceanobacillus piezotolerans]|uniref:DNA gyrase inhibitor n=1 Tax=Oceanobacillus piezotolerans TaxID=2448030 RepID=A0A498D9S4_9BACI|nr:GyrI-like domain-containing protein [Oceanobacillus piezotolerans]RLL43680.1 DNA gyrase inhibitor [Oceanobacillus piezotolerans]